MTRLARCFCLSLLALCFVSLWTLPVRAQEENRSIKMIGVDDQYINLEVDGKDVHVQLPDRYVVADEYLYRNLYHSIKNKINEIEDILLCVLVNFDDDAYKKVDPSFKGYRYSYFKIDYDYKKYIINKNSFEKEIENLKYLTKVISEETNQHLVKEKLSPFTFRFIFENNKILSLIAIEDRPSQFKYRIGFSKSYILVEPLIITVLLYHDINNETDLARLQDETLTYAKRVSEQITAR